MTTIDVLEATFIDTHAHLTLSAFGNDLREVCDRAWEGGLEYIVTIGSGEGIDDNRKAVELASTDQRIFAAVGVHPHDAKDFNEEWLTKLVDLMKNERVVAVGETGLDYHYDSSPREAQQECFRAQLKLAHQYDKPVVIHSREADEDTWRIIEEVGVPKHGGIFHCFSGDLAFAERAIEAGFYISFSGIVTFSKSHDLQGVASRIPLNRVLIETDCPYLAPQPMRGKRNEPAYVRHVAETLAEIKELSVIDVARITTRNAKKVFGFPGAQDEPRIAYRIRNSLYLNITNRCNLDCKFCAKQDDYEVKGHYLKLAHEPDVEDIFKAMGHPEKYDEVVFCGFGEPTARLEIVKEVAKRMKAGGVKRVRLNTDGLASLVYGRNIAEELKGLIDAMSVSLNAPDAATYASICNSKHGEKAYEGVKNFIREAKKYIPEVVATAVNLPEVDIEACRKVAEEELGVTFREREYISK